MFLLVVVQMTLSRERPLAVWNGAVIRFFSRVESQVGLKVTFVVERLLARRVGTHKIALANVPFQVGFKLPLSTVRHATVGDCANEGFELRMRLSVVLQVQFGREGTAATRHSALIRARHLMQLLMLHLMINRVKGLPAGLEPTLVATR